MRSALVFGFCPVMFAPSFPAMPSLLLSLLVMTVVVNDLDGGSQ